MTEPFIAEIKMFGGNFAPRGYAFCDGQLLSISQNTALFSLLGTTFGGNGTTTFGLPDLRGRFPMHPGSGPGLSPHSLGESGGVETVTLTSTQIPAHTHTATAAQQAVAGAGTTTSPAGNVPATLVRERAYSDAAPDTSLRADSVQVTVANAGGSQSHSNMPPFLGVNFIIALVGIYPSRS